eukprot:scaffold11929_cov107-Isochrysis_galbana.AAC.8
MVVTVPCTAPCKHPVPFHSCMLNHCLHRWVAGRQSVVYTSVIHQCGRCRSGAEPFVCPRSAKAAVVQQLRASSRPSRRSAKPVPSPSQVPVIVLGRVVAVREPQPLPPAILVHGFLAVDAEDAGGGVDCVHRQPTALR